MRNLFNNDLVKFLILLIGVFAWYNRTHDYKYSINTDPLRSIHKKILAEGHGKDLTGELKKMSDFEKSKFFNMLDDIMPQNFKNKYTCDTSSLYIGSIYMDPFATEDLFEYVLGKLQVLEYSGSITPLGYTYYYYVRTQYAPILLISFFEPGGATNYIICRLKNSSSDR